MTSTIEESLKDYKNYLNGKPNGVELVHATIPVKPQFNAKTIKELRKNINVSQSGLANLIGVSTRTVKAWETNQSKPRRPVQKLLTLLTKKPSLVNDLKSI